MDEIHMKTSICTHADRIWICPLGLKIIGSLGPGHVALMLLCQPTSFVFDGRLLHRAGVILDHAHDLSSGPLLSS